MSRDFAVVMAVLVAIAWIVRPGAAAADESRVALVIGNAAYANAARLPNPGRDADTIAKALREAGFRSVTVSRDAGRKELIAALNAFSNEAERADWAVVYFAGHGIEIDGINYLVPVDARLRSDRDIADEAVPLERVLQSIEASRKLRLVILDACRDNPFVGAMRRTSASRSIGRGLARIEPDGGTLVAFAAKHGQTAMDGDGDHSPFVQALSRRLTMPGIEINKLFRLVRDDVMAATARRQEPFVYGSLPGEDFFFVAGAAAHPGIAVAPSLDAKLPSTAPPPVAPKVAALPPAQDADAFTRPPPPDGGNAPVNAPLVSFSRSNAGWTASVSLPEPAIGLSWRLGEARPFEETGLLDVIDQRTGRRMPNPVFQLDADSAAAILQVRYVDAAGVTVGPFPFPFEPRAALVRDQRRVIEMVSGSWLSFRNFNGIMLYYTSLVSYRCAIKELRIGFDTPEPDRLVPLPRCDEANPFAIPADFVPYLKAPPGTRSASVQILYGDGSRSPVRVFKR